MMLKKDCIVYLKMNIEITTDAHMHIAQAMKFYDA